MTVQFTESAESASIGERHHVIQLKALGMAAVARDRTKVLNFNVGVLGHIDSGKTSLGRS